MEEGTPQVMVHVRFAPNGTVVEIGERPKAKNPQEWFHFLSGKIGGTSYQALSGGRGVFRLTREQCDAIRAEAEAEVAAASGAAAAPPTAAPPPAAGSAPPAA